MISIRKRIFIISFLLTSLAIYATAATAAAAFAGISRETVSQQSSYSMRLESLRGIIYDRELEPLTNREKVTKALCFPTEEVFRSLKFNAAEDYDPQKLMEAKLPFSLEVSHILDCDGIKYYESSRRYSSLCPHLLLTVDHVLDEKLRSQKELSCRYRGDALGNIIPGTEAEIVGESKLSSGIALTIDRDIQVIAEEAAELIDRGAVVVMEVRSGDIVAQVSRPDFDPENLEEYLHREDSPLVDRSFSAFAPGSVFKLVISAAALESGFDPGERYTCRGSIEIDGLRFHCYGGKAHGNMNLHLALQNSCNCYFMALASKLELRDIYAMALSLGLGSPTELFPGIEGDSGSIGSFPQLQNPRALANFAIGQGDVRVTPLQMAGLISCIAREGIYTIPNILEAYVDEEAELLPQNSHGEVRVMSRETAATLRSYMESVVKFGTGREAYSENYTAGAKTGTAQTGVLENGIEKLNYWFCGYVGRTQVPEYAIVVLREGASDGHNPCPQVFSTIAERLW